MPEGRNGDSGNGDADSKRGLWTAIRKFFDEEGETSLRAQIEEAIAEHEDEQASGEEVAGDGDLSPVELTMLRNLLHFSDHDADDVAIPRGEIIAIDAAASWDELVAQFAFMEWTLDGRLRHPSFLGLRFDKPARDVVREEPA